MLRIFQIWFDEQSKRNCFQHPAVTLHHNQKLTAYFENQVILDLRPYTDPYVGVWSHKAGQKLPRAANPQFSIDRLVEICEVGGFDVLGFHHMHRRQTILYDQVRVKYNAMFDYLMRRMGLSYSSKVNPRFNVLQNHFIARSEIMNDYTDFLARAVEIMESDRELKAELNSPAPYRPESGRVYPYHPFVCEKLVSAYLHLKPEIVCTFYKRREASLFGPRAKASRAG